MTIEIDIEKLKQRKGELAAEMSRVDGLLSLAQDYSALIPATPAPLPPPPPANVPEQYTLPVRKQRSGTPGLRRAVLLGLHTGPATENDLARALAWTVKRTREVISSMRIHKLCYLNEYGKLTLSEEGKTQAAWYLANPTYLVYCGGSKQ